MRPDPRIDVQDRAGTVDRFVNGSAGDRRLLVRSLRNPVMAVRSGRTSGEPYRYASQAPELLQVLDRLEPATGPDEPRGFYHLGVEEDFDDWRAILREALERSRGEDPDVEAIIEAAEVLGS